MRSSQEYKALLAKINVQKGIYAQQELQVNEELEQKIQYTAEKIKKFNILFVICFALMLVLLGGIYEIFKYYNIKKYIIYVIIEMVRGLIVILSFEIVYRAKLKKYNNQKEAEFKGKITVRDKIRELNNKISSLVVSIITLNEHFYELSSITSEELLYQKWVEYANQIIMAINKKYNFKATYTEYEEFLKEYEINLRKKEEI